MKRSCKVSLMLSLEIGPESSKYEVRIDESLYVNGEILITPSGGKVWHRQMLFRRVACLRTATERETLRKTSSH